MNQVQLFNILRSTAMDLDNRPDNRRAFGSNFDTRLTLDHTPCLEDGMDIETWQLLRCSPTSSSSSSSRNLFTWKTQNLQPQKFHTQCFQTPCVVQSCPIAQQRPSIESFLKRWLEFGDDSSLSRVSRPGWVVRVEESVLRFEALPKSWLDLKIGEITLYLVFGQKVS